MLKSLKRLFKFKHRETRHSKRIPLGMLLNFRRADETDWCQGVAANISSGGVLFHADQTMDVHTPIHMNYSLPASIAGRAGIEVGCKAEVARVKPPASRDDSFLFLVKILGYDAATR